MTNREYDDFVDQRRDMNFDDVIDTAGEALIWMNNPAASKMKGSNFINKDIVLGNLDEREMNMAACHYSFAMKLWNQGLHDAARFILSQMYYKLNVSNSKKGFARRMAKSRFVEQEQNIKVDEKRKK